MSASLAALQARFLAAVLEGSALADAIEPPDALDFYRGSVAASLRGALAGAYPVVMRLVGEAFFTEAARRYAAASPSRSGDLHRFGDGFASFLEGYPPAQALDYLADVARLEWMIHECLHARDAAAIDVARVSTVPEAQQGRLRARLAPAVRRMRSAWPVHAIWEANQPPRDGTAERTDGEDCVLVRRAGLDVAVERLDADAYACLEALAAGESLERAVEVLGSDGDRFPALLAQWCADGVIASLEPGEARA